MANNPPSMFDPKPQAKTTQQAAPNVRALPQQPKPESKQPTDSEKLLRATHDHGFWKGAFTHVLSGVIIGVFMSFIILALARENISLERWTAKREIQSDQLLGFGALSDEKHPEATPGQ